MLICMGPSVFFKTATGLVTIGFHGIFLGTENQDGLIRRILKNAR